MLLDSGADLHNFQPTMDDMMQISTCDVFIYVGGESDAWVDDVLATTKNEKLIAVDLMDALGERLKEEEMKEGMEAEEEEAEEEGPAYDEHIWLSLKNAAALCDVIAGKLGKADAANAAAYQANAAAYIEKINTLDAAYRAAADGAKEKTLLFADRFPFRYLTEDYGLDYYAAFMGCSAETEVSFDTVKFLAGKLFFACACILFSALTLCMYFKNGFLISAVYMSIYKAVPLTFLGLCSYLFAPKKNNTLFAYLLFGVLISFCMCVVSRVAIGTGLIISVPASLLLLRHMIGQLKENRQANVETENKDNKTKLRKQISYASTAAAMAILLLTETLFCFSVRLYQSPEAFYAKQPLAAGKEGTAYLDRGPLKGIYTLPEIQALYDGVLEDMDRIMAEKPKSLFTMAFCGWPNLYTNLPYGSNSLYDFTTDSLRDELYQLWEERPDKRPDCVYIPFFDPDNLIMDADVADDKLGSLKSAFPCTVQTGKMGYIVHIDWQT